MTRQYTLSQWTIIGVPSLIGLALLGALILHSVGIAWAQLVVPITLAVLIQLATYFGMFWVRSRSKPDFGKATMIAGAYGLGMGLLILHYGAAWGWLNSQTMGEDYIWFTVSLIAITGLCVALFSFARFGK